MPKEIITREEAAARDEALEIAALDMPDAMTPRIVVPDPEDVDLVILALHSFGNLHIALCDDPQHMIEITERVIGLIQALGVSYDNLDDNANVERHVSR